MAQDEPAKTPKPDAVDLALARAGGLTYLEIPAINIEESARFYASVFGWTSREEGSDPSRFSDPAGQLIGRFVLNRTATRPGLLPYIYVNQIDEAAARAIGNGGELHTPPRPEGNLRVAVVRDPAGNVIGMWQVATT